MWLVPTAGGPPRKLVEGGEPGVDRRRAPAHRGRARRRRHDAPGRGRHRRPVAAAPRRRARRPRRPRRRGRGRRLARRPRGRLHLHAARRPQPQQPDPRRRPRRRRRCARSPARRCMHDNSPAWSPDGTTIAYASERSGFYELHLAGARTASSRSAGADHLELAWHPDGTRLLAVRGRRNRFDVVIVDAADGEAEVVAEGGTWGSPRWTPAGAIVGTYEDHATPPELRLAARRRRATRPPRARRARAPLRRARGGRVRLASTAWRSRPSCAGRRTPRRSGRCPRSSTRTAARPTPTSTTGTATPSTSSTRATPGWRSTSAARPATGASTSASTTACGASTTPRTASPRPTTCARLDWVDGERLGIFGASYGSYMALAAVTDDPEHRFRCAVAKYGDCDIVTSWAQGDRYGVQDLERMMGHALERPRGLPRRLAVPPPGERPGAAAHRPRRARRARAAPSSPSSWSPSCAGWARPSSTSPIPPRATASCAPARSWTSTAAWSASWTGTSCENLALARAD